MSLSRLRAAAQACQQLATTSVSSIPGGEGVQGAVRGAVSGAREAVSGTTERASGAAGTARRMTGGAARQAGVTAQAVARAGAGAAQPLTRSALAAMEGVARPVTEAVRPATDEGARLLASTYQAGLRELERLSRQGADSAAALTDLGPRRRHRRAWAHHGHAAIEMRGLTGRASQRQRAAAGMRKRLTALRGVRWAEVNTVTAQVLIAFDEGTVSLDDLTDAVQAVEDSRGAADEDFSWAQPEHPADSAPLTATYAALAADLAGLAAGVAGRVARIPPPHPAVRVPLAVFESYPRVRRLLEQRIGPRGADVLLAVGNATLYGLADGPARPAVEVCYRLLLVAELRAHGRAWHERAVELCFETGPASGGVTGAPSVDGGAPGGQGTRQHGAGRPVPLPPGPVEKYADQVAAGSLLAAAGVFAATRDTGRAANALLAGVPTAARMAREGFAATVGASLAGRGVVIMDRSALRRLDRVSTVVIDSAALCAPRARVLSVTVAGRHRDTPPRERAAALWRAADRVLRRQTMAGLAGPGPWSDGKHKLTRAHPGEQAPGGPEGVSLAVTKVGGRKLGTVTVGCELDPLAEAVLGAARSGGATLLLTTHASTEDLRSLADEVTGEGSLTARVRELQAAGEGVLVVSPAAAGALAAADVGIGCLDGQRQVCWTADLICGPGLAEVWRLLHAAGRAAGVSSQGVRLAASGASLGTLLAAVERHHPAGRLVSPVHAASMVSLTWGSVAGWRVSRQPSPSPVRRTAWHAMDPDDVIERLFAGNGSRAGDTRGEGRLPAAPRRWRDQVSTVPGGPALATALGGVAGLARATLGELKDPLTPVLLVGAAASAVLGSGVDSALVGGVMLGNAAIGGGQRLRTEHALRALLLRERRPGRRVDWRPGDPVPSRAGALDLPVSLVPAGELRPGDLIALRPNDVVPADARLITVASLEVDESALTGESLPVAKDTAAIVAASPAERTCMVYDGTIVVAGTAIAVVVAVGEQTEAGRAAAAAVGGSKPTAGVQARLSDVTRIALPVTGLGGLAVTGLSMLRGAALRDALASGVAVAVAAVPEGLPLVATVAQLAAARRLSSRGVLVRSPRTLEALGRVDVLCLDKTGTLTEGRLEVAAAAAFRKDIDLASGRGRKLLAVAARACPAPGRSRVVHATDQAILDAAGNRDTGRQPEDGASADSRKGLQAAFGWELVEELPFQNDRGYSASLGQRDGELSLAVKGAPEVVLAKCTTVHTTGRAGPAAPMTAARRKAARATVERLAAAGLRVLAVAQASPSAPPPGSADRRTGPERTGPGAEGAQPGAEEPPLAGLVTGLTLLGFVAIADAMRPEAAEVTGRLSRAGVRPVMITGDHPATASAIAHRAGIPSADDVVTGGELDRLTETQRRSRVTRAGVFARVSPEQKVRIIADLRRAGHVVAMAGDGTNDAAAIRLADTGIGVSARGSTAARSASDLVLPGAEIARIADALGEGRALWRSVSEAVSILVGGNAGEVAFMLLGTAIGGRSPLNTRQLLLVNMLTDMFPALAVALGTAVDAQDAGEFPAGSLLGKPLVRAIAIRGGATTVGATLAWAGGRLTGRHARASTMGLAALISTQLGQTLLASRSPVVAITCGASAAALVAIVSTPGVSQFFGCTPLGPVAWGIVTVSSAMGTVAGVAAPRFLPGLEGGGETPPADATEPARPAGDDGQGGQG